MGILNAALRLISLSSSSPLSMESLKTPECSPGPFGVGENNTDSFSRIATDSALESIQQAGIYRRIVEWLSHSGIETNGYVTKEIIPSSLKPTSFIVELLQFLLIREPTLGCTKCTSFGSLPMPTFWRTVNLIFFPLSGFRTWVDSVPRPWALYFLALECETLCWWSLELISCRLLFLTYHLNLSKSPSACAFPAFLYVYIWQCTKTCPSPNLLL